jgi:hypothetical protein
MTVNDAYNSIQRLLLKSEHCKAILDGVTIPTGTPVNLSSVTTKDGGGGTKTHYDIGAGQMLPGSTVEFTSLTASREAATPKMVTLEALFTKKNKNFGGQTLKKRFQLEAAFASNIVTKCFSQMDNAVESACKSLDPNATFSGADCDLSTGFQEEIVVAGMQSKKKTLWVNPVDGDLKGTPQATSVIVEPGRGNHYCHCRSSGISCPTGYVGGSHWCDRGKKQSRCTYSRTYNGYKKCTRTYVPIGYYFID